MFKVKSRQCRPTALGVSNADTKRLWLPTPLTLTGHPALSTAYTLTSLLAAPTFLPSIRLSSIHSRYPILRRSSDAFSISMLAPLLLVAAVLLAVAATASPLADPARVLVSMGQSNNQGEGCCYNASVDDGFANMQQYVIDDVYSDSRYMRDIHNHTHQLTHASEPLYDGGNNRANIIGSLVALGKRFGTVGETVLVQTAVSGTSMAQWLRGGLLARAVQAAGNATRLAANSPITAFTWVQGESDSGRSTAAYLADLLTVIAIARNSTPGASPTTPFIVGSMVPEWTRANTGAWAILEAHRQLPNVVPHTAYVQMPLGYVDCAESIHFSATGQRLMGALMMEAMVSAYSNRDPGTVPNHPTNLTITSNATHVSISWLTPPRNGSAAVTSHRLRYKLYDRPANVSTYPNCSDLDASPPHGINLLATATSVTLERSMYMLMDGTWQFAVFALSQTQSSSGRFDSYTLHKLAPAAHHRHGVDTEEEAQPGWAGVEERDGKGSFLQWLLVAAVVLLPSFMLCALCLHRRQHSKQQPVVLALTADPFTSALVADGRAYHRMADEERTPERAA